MHLLLRSSRSWWAFLRTSSNTTSHFVGHCSQAYLITFLPALTDLYNLIPVDLGKDVCAFRCVHVCMLMCLWICGHALCACMCICVCLCEYVFSHVQHPLIYFWWKHPLSSLLVFSFLLGDLSLTISLGILLSGHLVQVPGMHLRLRHSHIQHSIPMVSGAGVCNEHRTHTWLSQGLCHFHWSKVSLELIFGAILLHLGRACLKLSQLQDKQSPEMDIGIFLLTCYEHLDLAKPEAIGPGLSEVGVS